MKVGKELNPYPARTWVGSALDRFNFPCQHNYLFSD